MPDIPEEENARFDWMLEHCSSDWIISHTIQCSYIDEGWGVWSEIRYHAPSGTFFKLDFEFCGVDLSGDRCTGAKIISHEEALSCMSSDEKARLENHTGKQS